MMDTAGWLTDCCSSIVKTSIRQFKRKESQKTTIISRRSFSETQDQHLTSSFLHLNISWSIFSNLFIIHGNNHINTMNTKSITLQLSITATNLPYVAGGFKDASSPFCVVTMLSNDIDEEPMLLGMTEVWVPVMTDSTQTFCGKNCILQKFAFPIESKTQ